MDRFPDEMTCIQHLEMLRWPLGVFCPVCGVNRKIYRIKRAYCYKCGDCGKQFSIRKGTIFEESHLPLIKWFVAAWLFTTNFNSISSAQLARELGVTQKTAWHVLKRLQQVADEIEIQQ